jgi:hypothetical protein
MTSVCARVFFLGFFYKVVVEVFYFLYIWNLKRYFEPGTTYCDNWLGCLNFNQCSCETISIDSP